MMGPERACRALRRNHFGEMLANPSASTTEHGAAVSKLTHLFILRKLCSLELNPSLSSRISLCSWCEGQSSADTPPPPPAS